MEKHLTTILKEMCDRVGAKFDEIDFNKDYWFREYLWTDEAEQEFYYWLIDYIMNHKDARKELLNVASKNKSIATKFAKEFIMNYGWMTFPNI